MAVKPRRTQEERRRATRRALLDAAAALFVERGYHAVSLDEIAAGAGLSRGALHYNFTGKQELLMALLEEQMAARGAAVAGGTPTPEEIVGAQPFDRDFSLLFLEFAAAAARDPGVGAALRDGLAAGRRANVPAVAALLEAQGLRGDAALDILNLVGAFVNGLAVEALAGEDLAVLGARFAWFLELVLAGLGERERR